MICAGAAKVDITPPAGAAMCGFAARIKPAIGSHDPLSVRALAVNGTAIVVADVIGLHGDMSARVRARCILEQDNVIIAALHTHAGPVSMFERLSPAADAAYLERLETSCVQAINEAVAVQRPATISVGMGADPGVAQNRRHKNGPVDRALPIARIRDKSGQMIAVMVAYACHPVVLGADNRLWSADYPHFVRTELERAYPGAMALFVTGAAGDANNGHSAHASISLSADPERSFPRAQEIGALIARNALLAPEIQVEGSFGAVNCMSTLRFRKRETQPSAILAARWRNEKHAASLVQKTILDHWIKWAQTIAPIAAMPLEARVAMLNWGGMRIVGLPGEIFAETALSIRAGIGVAMPVFIAGYAEDNPGYIPAASAFSSGGYEVDEAHRYYGRPATFAPGSAEELARAAIKLSGAK